MPPQLRMRHQKEAFDGAALRLKKYDDFKNFSCTIYVVRIKVL